MRAVVGLVQPCDSMADIGCDHGYVAIELVKSNICRRVIAMDINKGPLERAYVNIREHGLNEAIETRLSNGTKALKPGEAEGIICAGMGGKLVISILDDGRELVSNMKQLILQPQSEIDEVRLYLRENGFCIEDEDMVFEDGKYYPMMRVIKNNACYTEKSVHKRIYDTYGQHLLEKSHPILKQYLLWQRGGLEDIRKNLISQENKTQRQQERVREIDEQLGDILFCLNNYYK
jgi:tRNA (adenine22-N1)-methyltransferase